mmetsp:Transcript_3143/g.6355  ORF Transcript_3143/g.6355 Transcript_3143/m.6355 type:complete len:173 (+) Transcript_3143:1937-2455(+)
MEQQRRQAGGAGNHPGTSSHRGGDHVDDPAGLEGRRGGHAGHDGVGDGFRDHGEGDDDGAEELVGVGEEPDGGSAENFGGAFGAAWEAAAAQVRVEVVYLGVAVGVASVIFVLVVVHGATAIFLARRGRFDVAVVFDGFAGVFVGGGVFERHFLVVVVAEDGHGDLGQFVVA